MEYLWDHVKKDTSGERVFFNDNDIEFLWHCGFIDTKAVPFTQWAAFFVPYKDAETGAYLLNRSDFLLIEDFRYKGPVREPFDPHRINEGYYTDQGLDELFEWGVGPSVEAPQNDVQTFIAGLKKKFWDAGHKLVRIDKACKAEVGKWMDAHPSPLRRLELIMESKSSGKKLDPKLISFTAKGTDPVAALQASAFSLRPGSVAQGKRESLGKVTQVKEKKGAKAPDTTPLHKIRRDPRGTRG
jgi:hypothetical protein